MRRLIVVFLMTVAMVGSSGATGQTAPTIGYVGCSTTWMTVDGYHTVSEQHRLWPVYDTSSGELSNWANPNFRLWDSFDAMVLQHGQPEKVWFQVCLPQWRPRDGGEQVPPYSHLSAALDNLAKHTAATILLSGFNSFDPWGASASPWGYTRDLAAYAVNKGRATAGPDLGPLTRSMMADGSHPDSEGRVFLGQQMVAWFDG